jgi:hypothetical protein
MRALKKLQARNWATIRDLWISHLPSIDFDAQYPEPTLAQLPPLIYPTLNASGLAELPYVDGVREAIFREAMLLSRKFIYCTSLLPTLSNTGKNTWTAIAAYEAAFYGAKAFCFLLGIAPLNRNSKVYVDAFYEREQKQGKRKIIAYDTLRFHLLGDRLTHEVLWALTVRLLNTTDFDAEQVEIQTDLKIIDWEKFQSFRNLILYDGSFWPFSEQFEKCDIAKPSINDGVCSAAYLDAMPTVAPFAEEYFVASTLLRRLIVSMLESIAKTAPALRTEISALEPLVRPTSMAQVAG